MIDQFTFKEKPYEVALDNGIRYRAASASLKLAVRNTMIYAGKKHVERASVYLDYEHVRTYINVRIDEHAGLLLFDRVEA